MIATVTDSATPPLWNEVKLNQVMIDACCTHSNVVYSGVTAPNLTKFLRNIKESLPFNVLKSELRSCNTFRNASVPNEGGVGQIRLLATNFYGQVGEF